MVRRTVLKNLGLILLSRWAKMARFDLYITPSSIVATIRFIIGLV